MKRERGFTLMEILVVVAVIAVLAAVAIPVFSGAREKAARATDLANARSIQAVLAEMVMSGDIEFPEKRASTSEAELGVWVMFCRDKAYPDGYTTRFFCGANTGVTVNGVTSTSWKLENAGLQRAVAQAVGGEGNLTVHSSGTTKVDGIGGWDWIVVQYTYDPAAKQLSGRMYSGMKGASSGLNNNRGITNIEAYIRKH